MARLSKEEIRVTETKSNFEKLASKDVKKFLKKKGNFDYLSWAKAWEIMKKFDPEAKVVYRDYPHHKVISGQNEDFMVVENKPYLIDDTGAYVSVEVTIKGATEEELLPVLDYKNNPVNKPNAMQINNTLKRCFVKALALHGLGLYVFQGEDVPEPPKVDQEEIDKLEVVLESFNEEMGRDMRDELLNFVNQQTDRSGLLADYAQKIEDMTFEQSGIFKRTIAQKRKELEKEQKKQAKK